MGGGKDFEQEEGQRKGEVFGMMERIHIRSGHMERKGEFRKCKRSVKRI